MTSKACSKCKRVLPIAEFGSRKGTPDGLSYLCGDCTRASRQKYRDRYEQDPDFRAKRAEYHRAWQTANAGKVAERNRRDKLALTYGLTVEDYDGLVAGQDGKCAICGGLPSRTQNFHIDHSHATGVIRGLLCDSCNLGIGKFNDDPDLLRRAIEYLACDTGFVVAPRARVRAQRRFPRPETTP